MQYHEGPLTFSPQPHENGTDTMSSGATYKRILLQFPTMRCKLFMKNENVLDSNTYITQPFLGESANTYIN